MLGIPQEVVAPVDGVVGEMLAEPGDGVEYGQPLFTIVAARPAPAEGAIPIGTEDHVAASAGERA
jgi:pyruvate/2-oxoglutarate dehydrogenase complex dihydrolipoamide acyltransferase (E2) component